MTRPFTCWAILLALNVTPPPPRQLIGNIKTTNFQPSFFYNENVEYTFFFYIMLGTAFQSWRFIGLATIFLLRSLKIGFFVPNIWGHFPAFFLNLNFTMVRKYIRNGFKILWLLVTYKDRISTWPFWLLCMILVLRKERQEDHKFKASLGWMARPSLKVKLYINKIKTCVCLIVRGYDVTEVHGTVWGCFLLPFTWVPGMELRWPGPSPAGSSQGHCESCVLFIKQACWHQ